MASLFNNSIGVIMTSKYKNKINPFEDLRSDAQNSNCGIYKITNLKNNKAYIGQSTDIKSRWNNHKRELKNDIHRNSHLQNAFNKYGEEAFEFRILEETFEENLDDAEEYWIDYFDSTNPRKGYNLREGANSYKHRQEIQEQVNLVRQLRKEERHYFKMRHINNKGGLTKLYEMAKENKTLKDVTLELEISDEYIREYLREQGFSGWRELVKQARTPKTDYSIIDDKGGVLFIMDQLINGIPIRTIAKNLNVKTKFINDYLAFKGFDIKEINKYISKWRIELVLENFGGMDYIKKNLKLGLSMNEISEECKISKKRLTEYLKEYS